MNGMKRGESMGLDLTLLVVDKLPRSSGYAHTMLPMVGSRRLFEQLMQIPSEYVPRRFNTYLCRDDRYEEPQNRAVWAYLRELPEESMVALYWD